MIYLEHPKRGSDFPVWECHECGAELPDADYTEDFEAFHAANNALLRALRGR